MEFILLWAFTVAYWLTVLSFMRTMAKEAPDRYRRRAPVGSRYLSVFLASALLYTLCLTAMVWITEGEEAWWTFYWKL